MNIIERLDAETVARNKQLAPALIPDGKGEHSAQIFYTSRAMLFVQMQDSFRVAMRVIAMPLRLKSRAIIRVVINLSVVSDIKLTVFNRHRLLAACAGPPLPAV